MSQTDIWNQFDYFPSSVYLLDKPEYLETVKAVSDTYIAKSTQEVDALHPCKMTEDFRAEPAMHDFNMYVLNTAWNVLKSQGYAMDKYSTVFSSLWTQDHDTGSSMAEHIHGGGIQLTAFYFLDVPEESSKAIFHDPRASKVIIALEEEDNTQATQASRMVNFTPKAGMLMISNAYLPHSFTKNGANKALQFVHMNINVIPSQAHSCQAPAEVI